MQPKYSDRYSTAAEMIDDLETAIMYLDGGIRNVTTPVRHSTQETTPKPDYPSFKFDKSMTTAPF